MDSLDQASLRVLRWRFEGLPARIGQIVLIGGLCWLHTPSPVILGWVAMAVSTCLIDAEISRRLFERLNDRWLAVLNGTSRTVSAAAFAVVCFVLLLDRTGFGLAAAVLVACAINLNNAVMTRGSQRFFLTLVAPSSACLIALPFVAVLMHHSVTFEGAVLLTFGAGAYTVFIVLLASALYKEGQALRTALEAAEAASRAKSAFLAMTSHEIRTPLNGVLGMARAMGRDTLSEVQRERVGVIQHSGEALLEILNDILDLSKIEAGKLDLETAPFDLEAVAWGVHDVFSASALDKGLAFRLEFDDGARGVYEGDAARVRQVLINLISNALKFTEAGEVVLCVVAHEAGVTLSVRDSGAGVAADRAEHLFSKFVQADSSTTRRYGGTGLGLAICRELCEAMGGEISVTSELGHGSTFIVDLPLARDSALAPPQSPETPPRPGEGMPVSIQGLKVLAAEDNATNQLVLRTILEQFGVVLTLVGNGDEAIRAWETGGFDLILMDVQMPVMDGPTAAGLIRAREGETGRTPIPIIALTANAMHHQVAEYAAAGMTDFVAKPIAIDQLCATIERVARSGRQDEGEAGLRRAG